MRSIRCVNLSLLHKAQVALLILVAGGASLLHAQPAPQLHFPLALQQEWQEEFREFTLDNYRGLMQPLLTPAEAPRLGNVRVDFPVGPHDHSFNFHSYSDGRVVMPVASLLFYKDLAFSQAWLSANGYSTQPALDYVSILAHGGLERWPEDQRLPKQALGIPANAGDDAMVVALYEQYFLDIVLFILGHELGHILHGFEGPNSSDFAMRRRAELAADAFALELFRRMQRPPLGASLYFATTSRLLPIANFAGDRADWDAWLMQRTHPLDGERIGAAAQFIGQHRADFEKRFAQPGTAALRLDATLLELRTLAEIVDDRSASLTQADCAATYLPQDLEPRVGNIPDINARPGERFADEPYSGVYEGKLRSNKSGESTALRLVLRRDGGSITGESQYLCFRGRVDGKAADDGTAFLRWYVGSIRRSISARSDTLGHRIEAAWRSDDPAVGGDGDLNVAR